MIIKATFIGEDGSWSYQKGKEYTINLQEPRVKRESDNSFIIYNDFDTDKSSIPYQSMRSFLMNWDNISLIK
jgi:hypothetical protein